MCFLSYEYALMQITQVRFKMATGELKFNNDDNTYPEWKKYLHKWELA